MAEAGGSAGASGSYIPSDEDLKKADEDFERGISCIKANKLDDAVQLFGDVLQVRIAKYGGEAVECASTYYRYGAALFYKAQEENDVFGAPVQSAVRDHSEEREAAPAPAPAPALDPNDKGKAKVTEPAEDEDPEEDEDGEGDEEGGDDAAEEEGEEDGGDMQLAWEMLEVARTIYNKSADKHKAQLADVHMLLADLALEQENFESALTDYRQSLALLDSKDVAQDRRRAELHYKSAVALQFLQQSEEALKEAKAAIKIIEARVADLQAAPAAEAAEGTGTEEPSAASAEAANAARPTPESSTAAQEIEDLEAVLEDMWAKVDELKEAVREMNTTKATLRSTFMQAASSLGGGPPSSSGAVMDLGVVGQGRKRINLQPQGPQGQPSTGVVATTAALPATQLPKGKRSLEDMMGGPGGETTFGFGASAPTLGGSASQPGGGVDMKKPRQELQEQVGPDNSRNGAGTVAKSDAAPAKPASLPAFLQPGNVEAVYKTTASANGSAENVELQQKP